MAFHHLPLLLIAVMSLILACQALCPIRLPQKERSFSVFNPLTILCNKKIRKISLNVKRGIYGIRRATPKMPYNRLNMDAPKYLLFLGTNPFLSFHSNMWIKNGVLFKAAEVGYTVANGFKSQDMTMKEYADLRKFYRNHASSPLNLIRGYMNHPSNSQPFQSDFTKWISDHFFAEQRLSGVNPMTIQKVTFSNRIGMHYNRLKRLLNPKFNLVRAVKKVLSRVNNHFSLTKAIKDGHLFVLYHPLNRDVESSEDKSKPGSNRKMWSFKSPIAIFASRPENAALTPVAIQMDDGREAPVYTPQDGDNWMLAKLNAQLSDYSNSQIIEHLCKVHFTIEAVCLAVERQLSEIHPLYDFMRFHCRGIFTANTLGGPTLLNDEFDLDHILEFGNEGANYLTRKAAKLINWHDLDLKNNVKRRGVDDKRRLPYYPYRDDGIVIYDVLNGMVRDYINTFYKDDRSVRKDFELQHFAYEVSKKGKGSLRGFPASLTNKPTLIKTFTRILWIMTGQHAAINYPQADYGSYIPNLPTKLYDVKGVAKKQFSTKRLNNRKAAAKQLFLVSALSSFRMDRLFDYGRHLRTQGGKRILNYYKHKLERDIESKLLKRNKKRLEQGHLTYPYFQPRWLTNGIQA